MKDSNIWNKINIIKNVILNTEYKKDPRIWWVLVQSLNGDGKYQDHCGVRMKQSPEGASIFIPSEKRKFSLCYWNLEKAHWRPWGRSVDAQSSMAFKTEIWRSLSSLGHCGVAVNKGKGKTRTPQKHSQFWWAARRAPLTNPGGPQVKKSYCQRYWSTSKEGQLPKCPASPLFWEERLSQQKLGQSHHT